jgi:DNA polymerase III subunit chi
MTRVDFYLKAASKVEVARKLATKAFKSGKYIFIYTCNRELAAELDRHFWLFPPLSFLPHVASGNLLSTKSPVLIGDDPVALQRFDVLINCELDVPEYFSRFDRVLEIVTVDPNEILIARGRFRHYKERGYLLDVHDLSAL